MHKLTFHDYQPRLQSFYDAVVEGLSCRQKSIPPKFFYDEQGSRLFDCICQQPEYYPPAVESRMLSRIATEVASLTGTGRVLIEPGVGSASKVRFLIDALRPSAFVAMDISFDYLKAVVEKMALEYRWLSLHAVHVDFTHALPVPREVGGTKRLVFFPGSSLGNFDPDEAVEFLKLIRETVRGDGMLLIGVDTKKETSLLNAAYNDTAGMTARFNVNLLHRMRRELNADINPNAFEHRAFYNAKEGRIEMHLVSRITQQLRINDYDFHIGYGESLHTENSYKYTPAEFLELAHESRFSSIRHWIDDAGLFAIYLLKAC
jgi:dimethylhistidine N-methyltransferase